MHFVRAFQRACGLTWKSCIGLRFSGPSKERVLALCQYCQDLLHLLLLIPSMARPGCWTWCQVADVLHCWLCVQRHTVAAGAVRNGVGACVPVQVAARGGPALLGSQQPGALRLVLSALLQLHDSCGRSTASCASVCL